MSQPPNDEFAQIYLASFAQALQELGWTIGRNVRVARPGTMQPALPVTSSVSAENASDYSRKWRPALGEWRWSGTPPCPPALAALLRSRLRPFARGGVDAHRGARCCRDRARQRGLRDTPERGTDRGRAGVFGATVHSGGSGSLFASPEPARRRVRGSIADHFYGDPDSILLT
jgi:hypothetical protein